MSFTVEGIDKVDAERTEEGHRNYTVRFKVRTTDILDGPSQAMVSAGLFDVGDTWDGGGLWANDTDDWAFCSPYLKVEPALQGEPCDVWYVEQKFTTNPRTRCYESPIEDPLLEPAEISGSFVKITKQAQRDRFGRILLSSARTPIFSSALERDYTNASVKISFNTATLDLDTWTALSDHTNDATLWGLGVNKVKFSHMSWERLFYAICTKYYKVSFDFEINFAGFIAYYPDISHLAWDAGIGGFNVVKDLEGNNLKSVALDGSGNRLPDGSPPYVFASEIHDYGDLTLLGIPATL